MNLTPSNQPARKLSLQRSCRVVVALLCAAALVLRGTPADASTNSNRMDITLQGLVTESITLAVVNPVVAFGLITPGTTNAAPLGQNLAITTSWILSAGETVKLYAYFDSASNAMTGTLLGDAIPTSAVTATFNGGATQTFTQSSPFTASSTAMNLYSVAVVAGNAITAARLDTLALTLNLTGVTLHPDSYTGTLHLQAQAL